MSRYERANKKRKVDFDSGADARDPGKTAWKPSASFTPIEGGRQWTLSVAVGASVLKDTFTADQQIAIPGRIGRALAVFNVDEVVIYDDTPWKSAPEG
ncbi:unnamed protein product [Parascedosporium putredinis]|uniref:Uncharacterized protein n=1 Tax=Parascedosporium putredinis TaxID=1442378 RepID=A0A9P1M6C2_9PEZI|nr:unnamed protein product [Parascedosporium putredinis]CAI7988225.1 unnamed protein product [Parascedosporium putredinis]